MMTWHYAVGIQTEYFCAIYCPHNICPTIISHRFERKPIVELKYNFCSLPRGCLMMKLSRQNFVIKHFLGKLQKNKLRRFGNQADWRKFGQYFLCPSWIFRFYQNSWPFDTSVDLLSLKICINFYNFLFTR